LWYQRHSDRPILDLVNHWLARLEEPPISLRTLYRDQRRIQIRAREQRGNTLRRQHTHLYSAELGHFSAAFPPHRHRGR